MSSRAGIAVRLHTAGAARTPGHLAVLRVVIPNLVQNAICYAAEGSEGEVALTRGR